METQNKVAIFMNEKGIVSVHNFAHNIYVPKDEAERLIEPFLTIGDGSVDDFEYYRRATLEELVKKDLPGNVEIHIIDKANVPQDRYFRNAWQHDDKANFVIDMPKAIEIHKAALREERAPLLAALDLEYLRADEAGDSQAKLDIVQKKNELRDITKHPEISAAATPEELKVAALSVIENIKAK